MPGWRRASRTDTATATIVRAFIVFVMFTTTGRCLINYQLRLNRYKHREMSVWLSVCVQHATRALHRRTRWTCCGLGTGFLSAHTMAVHQTAIGVFQTAQLRPALCSWQLRSNNANLMINSAHRRQTIFRTMFSITEKWIRCLLVISTCGSVSWNTRCKITITETNIEFKTITFITFWN